MNFIVVEHGDNDFGHYLFDALRNLMDDAGGVDFCPVIAKEYILEHAVSANRRKHILMGWEHDTDHIRSYLSKMRVTFCDKLPTESPNSDTVVDADGGSVYYDINLDKVFYL